MFISKIKFVNSQVKKLIPYPHNMIENHYGLILENKKFLVFTKNPLKVPMHPPSYKIADTTINGEPKTQYLSSYVYKPNPKIIYFEKSQLGEKFLEDNELVIKNVIVSIDLETVVELAQYIT